MTIFIEEGELHLHDSAEGNAGTAGMATTIADRYPYSRSNERIEAADNREN